MRFIIALLSAICLFSAVAAAKKAAPTAQTPAGAETSAAGSTRFTDAGDGTVLDNNTSIVWLKDAHITKRPLSRPAANQYIQKMNSGELPNFGHTNWRLPSIEELESLVDSSQSYPALPPGHPYENVRNHFYWSSSVGTDIVDYIWVLDLASGEKTFDYESYCNFKYVWPVRSGAMPETTRSGAVMAGGLNEYGQLGDGTTEDRVALLPSKGLTEVIKVAAGMEHAVAVKSDGKVWAWGRNREGQLGTGTTKDSHAPTLVKGLWNVVEIAAGKYHSVALKTDGSVWAWGRNSYGQLGDGH
jgi:hypothetical protein